VAVLKWVFNSIKFEKNNIKLYDLDKPAMHGGAVIQQKWVEESKRGRIEGKSSSTCN
jgi:hypothetical protein